MDLVDTMLIKDDQKKENKSDLDRPEIDIDKAALSENQRIIGQNGRLDGPFSTNGNSSHTQQPTKDCFKAPYMIIPNILMNGTMAY